MDQYLSDKRVEAAVNRAVKRLSENLADLERELRGFAQTSMPLEQEKEAIQKKLEK
jgi:hypothetical protein